MGKRIEGFEDLDVWKEGMELAKEVYSVLKNCKDYALRDQIHRAAISVPSNIAEGFERQTNKEFIQFLYIAKGSCGELRTQLYLANELQILDNQSGSVLIDKCRKISSMLFNLIKTRRDRF
ncbi:MAG: four helix bundle protein [Bacteroidetes bacterium]|nr:four helix bundle protein [Bacteroidota bacterium]